MAKPSTTGRSSGLGSRLMTTMSQGWETRQRQTRAEILQAAGELIGAHGVDGLTMRKLADRANVAVATLYNQFDDRNGVLMAFVLNGLDQLEIELDEQPAGRPIDCTRTLLDGLDETVGAAEHVWRPVLAALRASPAAERMGTVGQRIVASIEADLVKAQADGLLIAPIDADLMAQHIFFQKMRSLERWAAGTIDWQTYRLVTNLAIEVIFASVLVEPLRQEALARAGITSGVRAQL